MVFRVLADLVVVTHFCFIIFIAVGGLLAWRWPRLFWLHLPAFIYGTVIITVGFTCPLTPLEKYLRRLGQQKAYPGGFVDHYISGVIYPEKLTWLVQSLVATAVVIGYVGLTRTTKRRRASAKVEGTAAYPNRHESAEPEDSLDGRCRRAQ